MIVIVARFETDGDYCVNNERTGLTSPPDDEYCHSGVFLCADSDEAMETLERLFKGISETDCYLWQRFVMMFAEAISALDSENAIRHGLAKFIGGNYEGTFLYMQEITEGAQ